MAITDLVFRDIAEGFDRKDRPKKTRDSRDSTDGEFV